MQIKVLCREGARFDEIRRAAIEKDPEAEVSGGVWRVEDLPTFIDGVGPDVLIVDPANQESLRPIEALTQRRPDIEILLVSQDTSADFLMQAMREGVREGWSIVRHIAIANINEFGCRVSGMGQLWPVRAVHN